MTVNAESESTRATSLLPNSLNYLRIAWQSALAASICLGLPAGLLFWLVLLLRLQSLPVVERFKLVLQNNSYLEIVGALIGAFVWGILLSKISGYHKWWLLLTASMLGIYLGRRVFWLIYTWMNYDFTGMPVYMSFAINMIGQILIVTFCTGLTHGLILRNRRAALIIALTTSLVSVLAATLIFLILDQSGIRVGTGNAAMPKVTALCTMIAGIFGGASLGIWFSRYVVEDMSEKLQAAYSKG